MSNGEGARTSTDPVGRPEALAKAEEQLRQDLEVEATVTALLREQFGGFTRVAKEIAAGLAKPVTALLAMGIIACVTDIDKNPPKNPTSASASANPGSSGTAGAGGGPPDPDKWKKKEGALYGMDNFKLVAPATAPAFDQPETKYRDTAQCEVDGIPYTLFTLDDEGLGGAPTLQFASGTAQSPEDAMNSATADFVDGLEEFLKYSLGEIACYKDKIIFDNYGNLKMATLVSENGILKATDIIELPFSSDEITILVDAGVPYLYYGSGTVARVSLSEMLSNPDWEPEPVSELDGLGGSLPAMIIPPDPETGEGLYFGNKGSVVYASKTLAGLAASTALVYELNGSPAAFYTGNVTATPVYNAEGKLVKVFVTFVRQKTKFSKRKLMYVVYEIEDVVVPPPEPPPEPAPETNEPDTVGGDGDTVTPTEDIPTDGDIPWELLDTDDDVPKDPDPDEPLDAEKPKDEGIKPTDQEQQDPDKPPDQETSETDNDGQKPPDALSTDVQIADSSDIDPRKPDPENPDTQTANENLFKLIAGNCTATITLLNPEEAQTAANKYGIDITGHGTEDNQCIYEVQIEGSPKAMIYTFWNDVEGNVQAQCQIVDKTGGPKPFCEILAVNNLFDVVESGEGTEGNVLGTATGSTASAWTIAYRQGLEEVLDGEPELVDYVEVRNNKAGTTVLMKLNGTQILALTEAGIWHKIKAATGEEVPFFPAMPNPLEGPDGKIPWELQSETASAETSSPPPSNNSEGCTVGRLAGSPSGAQKSAPSENPTGNSAWMLILAIAALASRLFKSKQRA